MESRWYVLRSKPKKEDVLYRHAAAQGFKIFYPRIPVRRANPRARPVVPYFPGYMFVHVELASVGRSTFTWMPHALGLVAFDDEPAHVEPELIAAIHERVRLVAEAGGETLYGLQPGDPVTIRHGPFKGYEAIFDARLGGDERVRVLLTMLNDRTIPLELRAGEIERKAIGNR